MTGLEIFAVLAILAWGVGSPDRVAAPTRSALRSGMSTAVRSGLGSARSAWRSGAPGRVDRAARGRARLDSWGPIGRFANWFTDRVQGGVFGAGRIGWNAVSIGSGAAQDGWASGRQAWRDRAEEHRTAREYGEKSAWGTSAGIIRDTFKPPVDSPAVPFGRRLKDGLHDIARTVRPRYDAATGCVWCGREAADWGLSESGDTICDGCRVRHDPLGHRPVEPLRGRERTEGGLWRRPGYDDSPGGPDEEVQHIQCGGEGCDMCGGDGTVPAWMQDPKHGVIPEAPSPAGEGTTPTPTQKENQPVANPTGQLDIPDINALQALANQLAAASEIATQMAGHAATTTGLPDALAFDPGKGVIDAIHAVAEASPDPKGLAVWAELVQDLKRDVDRRVGELEILATTQVKGHTDQLTPA